VRDWKNYLESLADACRTSLIETYKNNERDATPEQVEALFTNKRFRKEAVQRMRNASVTRVMSADPQFVCGPGQICKR
jgi:3-phenylpropionate/cinnamic acid dioxygenase small subunit